MRSTWAFEPRSITQLVYAGEMEWSRPQAMTLAALSEIFQIRVRERVEEDMGSTYSIRVGAAAYLLPDPEYRVYVYFGSDPERTEELLEEVFATADWLVDGVDQSYLDRAKELLRATREEQLRKNDFWLAQIKRVVERGEEFRVIPDFERRVDALTLEQITAAAQRYLRRDRLRARGAAARGRGRRQLHRVVRNGTPWHREHRKRYTSIHP